MSIHTNIAGPIPESVLADGEAIINAIRQGQKPDPQIVARVRSRAQSITERIGAQVGKVEIGTKAIRELRDR